MSDYFHRAADETRTGPDTVPSLALPADRGHADERLAFTVRSRSDAQDPAARHAATPRRHDATSHPRG